MMILNSVHKKDSGDPVNSKVIRRLLRKVPDRETCSFFNSDLRSEILAWSKEEYEYISREYLGRKDGVLFINPGGKDIPGGEHYPGLDPEFVIRISREITERALAQGAFNRIRLSFGIQGHDRKGLYYLLIELCMRIPGFGRVRSMVKKFGKK